MHGYRIFHSWLPYVQVVSRGQTSIFHTGRYRLQYKRPFSTGAYTASDNALYKKYIEVWPRETNVQEHLIWTPVIYEVLVYERAEKRHNIHDPFEGISKLNGPLGSGK